MEDKQSSQKRRRLHLDVVESVRLSQSEEGSVSLRQPVDRTHPAARSEQAMAPRYRGRFKMRKFIGPRRVSSQSEERSCPSTSSAPGIVSDEDTALCISDSDDKTESRQKGQKRFQEPSTSRLVVRAAEDKVNILDAECLPDTVSVTVDKNCSSSEEHPQNNCEWENENYEQEMVEKSSDQSIYLLSVLGGFKPAASLQQKPSGFELGSMSSGTFPSRKTNSGMVCKKPRKKQWVNDPSQSCITSFMSHKDRTVPSTASSSSVSSDASFCSSAASTSNGRQGTESHILSDKIVLGSPSKMYSPIKKVSRSVYVISDDSSPDNSQEKTTGRTGSTHSQQTENVAKRLFTSCTAQTASSKTSTCVASDSYSQQKSVKQTGSKLSAKSRSSTRALKQKSKLRTDSHQRSLTATSSTSSPIYIDFDDADISDFTSTPAAVPPVKQKIEVGPTFGLLNDSKVKVVEEYWFQKLPTDIIENIFCSLPMTDLCLNVSLVCRDWNSIISNSKFMPWKKMYYKYKVSEDHTHTEIRLHIKKVMEEGGLTNPSTRLLELLSFMQTFKTVNRDNNACKMLRSHPKYEWALALLEERAPQLIQDGEPNPWTMICALVLISATVEDIHCTLRLLTSPHSQLLCVEVLECYYCIATLFLAFLRSGTNNSVMFSESSMLLDIGDERKRCVTRGLHYRLFYALYLYENSFVSNHAMLQQAMTSCPGQQTIVRYGLGETEVRLTHEQLRIIRYTPDLNAGESVKIFAFAGTGKTTTLLRYTQMRPHLKFLLIVFNKSVCTHAQSKFPRNVTCKTGHGLAFAVMGRRYAAKKQLNAGNLRVYDVAMALEKRKTNKENLFIRAKFVMETLKNFLSSEDFSINTAHAPLKRINDSGMTEPIPQDARTRYAQDAASYWNRMVDFNDSEVRMTHDGYLKLYQLSKPSLKGYDIILVDEAQDLTPVLLNVIQLQTQPKIFVGDQHQQIYAFRGAVNAMKGVEANKVFYLTQSFRFGPEIAQVANTLLDTLKHEHKKNIVGHATPGIIIGKQVGQLAVLCRSNFTVFAEAVSICVYSKTPVRVAFVGGLDGFGFSMLEDIYALMLPEAERRKANLEIQNRFIARFNNLGDLEKYAEKTMDVELMGKVRIVRTYHTNLPQCLNRIRAKAVSSCEQADIVFSTVHKAKGLEFPTVKVTEDFLELPRGRRTQSRPCFVSTEEANLLYVAVTRARYSLIMSRTIKTALSAMGGGLYEPVLTKNLRDDLVVMKFIPSQQHMEPKTPQAISLYRPEITLGNKEAQSAMKLSPFLLRHYESDYACLFGCTSEQSSQQE